MSTKNTNCLEGIRCPKCKQEERFRISCEQMMEVTDDGTEGAGDVEWQDTSHCSCDDDTCGYVATVKDFKVCNQPKNPLNDEDYEGNDKQTEDLKEYAEGLQVALSRAIHALNLVPCFKLPHDTDERFTSYKLIPMLDKVLKGWW